MSHKYAVSCKAEKCKAEMVYLPTGNISKRTNKPALMPVNIGSLTPADTEKLERGEEVKYRHGEHENHWGTCEYKEQFKKGWQGGFTLIEIFIVAAIVALLIVLAYPVVVGLPTNDKEHDAVRDRDERARIAARIPEREGPCPRPLILTAGEWDHCAAKTDPWLCLEQQEAWEQMLECARRHPRRDP